MTPTEVNGLTAAVVNVTLKGGPTRVMCVFLEKSAYLLAAQAKTSAAFSQFQEELESSLASFHPITSEEKALARPLRLRVIIAREGETFAVLARKSPLGRFAEGHLRVLNGLYPAGEPVAGQKLKIVE